MDGKFADMDSLDPHHPDRALHVEEAMEGAFIAMAETAERGGWTRDEVAFALLNLAVARILMIDAEIDTNEAIARAVRSIHGA